ncbi:hypothetical protein AusDCA_2503 [Desulfitobacterium sp. AusDCA]
MQKAVNDRNHAVKERDEALQEKADLHEAYKNKVIDFLARGLKERM